MKAPSNLLTPAEIRPLVIQARKAYDFQRDLGNLDPGDTFDAWRHRQVAACCGQSGISTMTRPDWRPVMAHFARLAGADDRALDLLWRTGKARDHSQVADTHESREEAVELIRKALADHSEWSVAAPGRSAIGIAYVLAIAVRQHHLPAAHVRDLDALRARLSAGDLKRLLFTVRNRISSREGRADPSRRSPQHRAKSPDLIPHHRFRR